VAKNAASRPRARTSPPLVKGGVWKLKKNHCSNESYHERLETRHGTTGWHTGSNTKNLPAAANTGKNTPQMAANHQTANNTKKSLTRN
jgi:hypothetical protein